PDGIAHSVATQTADNMPYKDVPVNLLTGTSYMATAESVPKGAFKASNAKTVSVSSGETYTYSIEIPSNNTVDLEAAINLNSKGVFVRSVIGNVIKSGQSGISSITLTVPDGIDSLFLAVSLTTVNPNSATTIYESGEKLELGTTASPWSPNPADPEYYTDTITVHNGGTYPVDPVITATMHGDNGVVAFVNDQGSVLQFGSPSEIDGVVRQKSERVYYFDFENEPKGIVMNDGALTYPNYRDNPSTPNKQKGIFSYGRPDGYDNAIAYPNTERNPSNYWSGPSMSGKLAANSNGKQNGNFEWRNLIRFATMTNWAGRIEFNLTYEGKIVASLALYDQSTTDDQVMFEGKIHDGNDARMLFHEALPRDLYSRANSFAVISKMGDQLTFRIDRVGGGNVIKPFTIDGFASQSIDGWTAWFSAFSDVLEANMGWQDSYFDWVNVDYWTDVPNRFKEGDVVKIDVAKRVVSLNGAEDPTLQTVGNDWEGLQLLPGNNTIQVLQSDWAKPYTCQVEWQEAWL
ncbi:phage tail family protein, partial [Lactobacillus rhamnosus]